MTLIKHSLAILTSLACVSPTHAVLLPYTFDLGSSGRLDVEFSGAETGNVWTWELSALAYDLVPGWNKSNFNFRTGSTSNPLFGLSLVGGRGTPRLEIDDDTNSPPNYDGLLTYFARLPSTTGDSVRTGPVQVIQPSPPSQTPEPASLVLLGLGLMGIGWMRRRQA